MKKGLLILGFFISVILILTFVSAQDEFPQGKINDYQISIFRWEENDSGDIYPLTLVSYGKAPDMYRDLYHDYICVGSIEYRYDSFHNIVLKKDYSGFFEMFKRLFGMGVCEAEFKEDISYSKHLIANPTSELLKGGKYVTAEIKPNQGLSDSLFNPEVAWPGIIICKIDMKEIKPIEDRQTEIKTKARNEQRRLTKEEFDEESALRMQYANAYCSTNVSAFFDSYYPSYEEYMKGDYVCASDSSGTYVLDQSEYIGEIQPTLGRGKIVEKCQAGCENGKCY